MTHDIDGDRRVHFGVRCRPRPYTPDQIRACSTSVARSVALDPGGASSTEVHGAHTPVDEGHVSVPVVVETPTEDAFDVEAARLSVVKRYDVLDTPPDGHFDRITRLAAQIFHVPISIVTIVDVDRVWFKSHHGIDATDCPGARACARPPSSTTACGWQLTPPSTRAR